MAGGAALRTVTLKTHSTVPQPLEAVQSTEVVPIGKKLPEGGLQITSAPGVAFTVKSTWAAALHVSTVMSGGH